MKLNPKKILEKYWPYISLFLLNLFIFRNFIGKGVINGHDIGFHLPRIANYFIALKDFHFPVRWAKNLNYKFGYPAFNFYYPLGYFLAMPFFAITNSIEISYELTVFFVTLFGSFFLFQFLSHYVQKESAYLSTILFITSSPFLMQIFVRQAFGEIIAWSIFPFCLWSLSSYCQNLKNKKFNYFYFLLTCLSIFLLSQAHNMIFVFGFCFLIGFLIFTFPRNNFKSIFLSFLPLILGFTLSFYFFLPMIIESNYTVATKVDLVKEYSSHFIYPKQFILSSWGYGHSHPGLKNDGMPFNLGYQFLTLLSLVIVFIFIKKIKLQKNKNFTLLLYSLLVLIFSLFLMTDYSYFIWQTIKPIQMIQFPWRIMFLTTFSLAIISALILDNLSLKKIANKILFISFFLFSIFLSANYSKKHDTYFKDPDPYMYKESPFTTSLNDEFFTQEFSKFKSQKILDYVSFSDQLKDLNNSATFSIKKWKTAYHEYEVESTQSAHIVEHIMYFPGWKTWVDEQEVEIITNHPDYYGINTYQIPAGKHQIVTKFTEDTKARIIGDRISILSLISIIYIYFKNKIQPIKV